MKKNLIVFSLAASFCLVLLAFAFRQPIGDYGNYYYGGRIFRDQGTVSVLYSDIHSFNEEIKSYDETGFFENYIPVPPFSLLFYYPFTFLGAHFSKQLFNILSILIFALSLARYMNFRGLSYKQLFYLPLLFLPIYSNLGQGQSYLLVVAALFEIFMAGEERRHVYAGSLLALIVQLKIFPVFVLIYFFARKDYRTIGWFFASMLCLFVATIIVTGSGVVTTYYSEILPRLARNEIVDPFYIGHQSISILLQNFFSFDAIKNSHPILDMPIFSSMAGAVINGVIIYVVFRVVKENPGPIGFGFTVFSMILINSYVTVYSLVLLLPFLLSLNIRTKREIIILAAIGVACNLPVAWLTNMPLPVNFERIFLFIIIFIFLIVILRPRVNFVRAGLVAGLLILASIARFDDSPDYYLTTRREKGIYYQMGIAGNKCLLKRCLGGKDQVDTLFVPMNVESIQPLGSHPLLQDKKYRIRNIFLINGTDLLYLSDLHQGIGMYQPRLQHLR